MRALFPRGRAERAAGAEPGHGPGGRPARPGPAARLSPGAARCDSRGIAPKLRRQGPSSKEKPLEEPGRESAVSSHPPDLRTVSAPCVPRAAAAVTPTPPAAAVWGVSLQPTERAGRPRAPPPHFGKLEPTAGWGQPSQCPPTSVPPPHPPELSLTCRGCGQT